MYGPGTFLNRAVAAVNTQIQAMMAGVSTSVRNAKRSAYKLAIGRGLGRAQALKDANAAGQLESQQQLQSLEQLAVQSGITSLPSIDSPQFIPQIVFDQTRGVNQPKSRFAYLFPTANDALIQIRLQSSLSDAEQAQAISWIRQAIKMPMFRSAYGGTYTVTGVPVVTNDLASTISGSISRLLIAVLLVMAVTLLIVFRSRPRLLPLAIALAAAGITFGLLAVLGATLTLASIAVLPILIGLAVDYGIQFQARAQEARDAAAGDGDAPPGAERAVAQAAGRAAPTIATAALATATGFLVLLLSPVPMVQGFGLLLVAGIAVAFFCALTGGSAALVLSERGRRARARPSASGAGRVPERVAAPVRGAGEILRGAGEPIGGAVSGASGLLSDACSGARGILAGAFRGAGAIVSGAGRRTPTRHEPPAAAAPGGDGGRAWRLIAAMTRHPGRVLALAAVLALAGWIADTQTGVQSDVTKLVPSNMPALRNLRTLEKVTGVSGEIDVTVRGANVATPTTVGWMIGYENKLLTHYGYVEERGCAHATLCPALSLPDLFSTSSQSTQQTA